MEKLSLASIKKKNFSDVYHFIYHHPDASKQVIAQGLHMSLPTLSQHLNTLLEEGLIRKSGRLESQIGRKAAAYSVIADARVAIGVEIIRSRVTIVFVNLYGEAAACRRIPAVFEDSAAYYERICKEIQEFTEEQGYTGQQILGAVFSVQGLVSADKRTMTFDRILHMEHMSADLFETSLGYPCSLCHDAEGAAAHTMWNRRSTENAVYLSISDHLGGAVIINGRIWHGNRGKSGTMEHMTLYPGGKKCYCGQYGCAECYCSTEALLEDGEELAAFFQGVRNHEKDREARWRHFLDDLALFLNNIHRVTDCGIILGGHISVFLKEEDFGYLHRQIREHTAFPEPEPFVVPGSQEDHEIPIGAALDRIREFLNQI